MIVLLGGSVLLMILPWLLRPRFHRTHEGSDVHGFLGILWWINRAYCATWHQLILINKAPLPTRGPAILIANHTSGVDNFLLQAGSDRVLGFMILDQIYNVWPLSIFCRLLRCIPVHRDGRDLSATRDALRALKDNRILPIFPEGRITPKSGREFGEGKLGAAFLTLQAKVPVIPAYIRGTPETRNVWKAGITPSKARVIYGEPLDLSEFYTEGNDRLAEKAKLLALTNRLMDAIKSLRDRSLALEDS